MSTSVNEKVRKEKSGETTWNAWNPVHPLSFLCDKQIDRRIHSRHQRRPLARQSREETAEKEKEEAKADMEKMLDYIDVLNELDTDGIEPMSHVFPVNNVFREDVVTNGDGSSDTLANAPLMKDQSFKVPKTIG